MKPIKNRSKTMMPSGPKQQQGVVLIVVLMVILLLAIAGAIAVRSSQTSLDLTTAAQVNQLLMQSSDVPLAHLENAQNKVYDATASPKLSQLDAMDDENGPIGYLRINGFNNNFNGAEYILCYQPTIHSGLYAGEDEHMVIRKNQDGTYGRLKNRNGFCQLDSDNAYTSSRGVVATQVSMLRPTLGTELLEGNDVETQVTTTETKNDDGTTTTNSVSRTVKTYAKTIFQGTEGTDGQSLGMETAGGSTDGSIQVRAYVTSVIPSLAISTPLNDVKACLNLPVGPIARSTNTTATNQRTCLSGTDTPYNIQVQDYMFVPQPTVVAPAPPPPAS